MKNLSNKSIASLLLLLFVQLLSFNLPAQYQRVKELKEENFAEVKEKEKAIVIDVRTEEEIAEGIIPGASVFADINSPEFEKKIETLDKSKTYIVYCRSGARSSRAAETMLKKGFTHVYNLKGGISNWKGTITKK